MMFWIAILAGTLFVWLAVRLGFYETWALLFNIVVSIYVSVFLTPKLAGFAPAPGGASSYHTALCLIVLAGGCFALLQGLSFVFLTGQFKIPFPRVFDVLLCGLLGFTAGFLILSFAAIVLTTTPLARHQIVGAIGFSRQSQQANVRCLARCCDLIHVLTRFGDGQDTTQAAIDRLIDTSDNLQPKRDEVKPDANESPAMQVKSPPRQGLQRRKIGDPSADMP